MQDVRTLDPRHDSPKSWQVDCGEPSSRRRQAVESNDEAATVTRRVVKTVWAETHCACRVHKCLEAHRRWQAHKNLWGRREGGSSAKQCAFFAQCVIQPAHLSPRNEASSLRRWCDTCSSQRAPESRRQRKTLKTFVSLTTRHSQFSSNGPEPIMISAGSTNF